MPRFALLHHDCPPHFGKPSHWDLMLEDEGVLLTWALDAQPSSDCGSGVIVSARQLADHRLAYLDYEGPVSGDRGHVICVDAGAFVWLERTPKRVRLQLAGKTLNGEAVLTHEGGKAWSVSILHGEHA
jgi:hypothetical protein